MELARAGSEEGEDLAAGRPQARLTHDFRILLFNWAFPVPVVYPTGPGLASYMGVYWAN